MSFTLDDAPVGLLSFDGGGNILAANRTLSQTLGYQDGALTGAPLRLVLTGATALF